MHVQWYFTLESLKLARWHFKVCPDTPKAQGLCRTQVWTLMIPTNISNLGCSPVEFHQLLWSDEKPWKDLPLSLAR